MICNRCSKELDEFDKQCDFTIHTTALYGSAYDGDKILLHLCCTCFDEIADECEVTPIAAGA